MTIKLVFTVSVSEAAAAMAQNVVSKTSTLDKQLAVVRNLVTSYATQCQSDAVLKTTAGQYLAECFGAKSVRGIADGFIAKCWKAACEKLQYTSGETARAPRAPKMAVDTSDKNTLIQSALKQDVSDIGGAFFGLREVEKMKVLLAMFTHMSVKEQASFLSKAAHIAATPVKKAA